MAEKESNTDQKNEGKVKEIVGNLTSPEAVLMLAVAGIFDLIGLVPIVADISDMVAGVVMVLWALMSGRLKEIAKKALLLYLVTLILEAIPIVSDITPIISVLGLCMGKAWPVSWIGWTFWILKNS